MGNGKRLKEILKERKISVAQLAKLSNISTNTLYAIIKRDSNISSDNLELIAHGLKLTTLELSDLLKNDTETIFDNSKDDTRFLTDNTDELLNNFESVIDALNVLTHEYQKKIRLIKELKQRKTELKQRKEYIESELDNIEEHLLYATNDLKNREAELDLIRKQLKNTES